MKKKLSLLIALVLSISFVSVFFYTNGFGTLQEKNKSKEDRFEVVDVDIINEREIYENIEQMARESELVVVGHFEEKIDELNLYRDATNIVNESKDEYAEAYVYPFVVDDIIAGTIDEETLHVALSYSEELEYTDKNGKKRNITFIDELYKEPAFNERYVLFLTENKTLETYFVPFHPYRLLIKADDSVEVDSVLVSKQKNKWENEVVRLEETKEELHIRQHNDEISDFISGEKLTEIKRKIKENF